MPENARPCLFVAGQFVVRLRGTLNLYLCRRDVWYGFDPFELPAPGRFTTSLSLLAASITACSTRERPIQAERSAPDRSGSGDSYRA